MRAELFADSVNEHLHTAAARAEVDVEVLAIGKEFPQIAESKSPAATSLVKLLCPCIL